jgi:catalase
MPVAEAEHYRYDPFDVTKVWRYKDYPLIPYGRLVLDRNPTNYFAEIEQAAFSPANFVPGVEASPDKLLQGRLFSYPDAQRHRLGANYALIPVNACPFHKGGLPNYQRDGAMRTDGNGGSGPNYSPNSHRGPVADARASEAPIPTGVGARTEYPASRRKDLADDFEQAGLLYRVFGEAERGRLVANLAGHMKGVDPEIQRRMVDHFTKADGEYGARVAAALGLPVEQASAA